MHSTRVVAKLKRVLRLRNPETLTHFLRGHCHISFALHPSTRVGLRDRALLLLGFAGAFRRSELVSLDVTDLEFTRAGLIVTLRKSKTDQEGKRRRLGIPYGSSEQTCPVRSLQAWLESARIVDGPVFR